MLTLQLQMNCKKFIHSNLISCSLIGSLVNTRSVLKMSTALRVLRPDCARCFWCVIACGNITSTDPFFSLGKVVNILHVLWHFKAILFIIFHQHEWMILVLCRVWIRLICIYFCSWNKTNPMHLPEFDACPMHSALRASCIGLIKIQCACIGFVYFTRKSNCAFINL